MRLPSALKSLAGLAQKAMGATKSQLMQEHGEHDGRWRVERRVSSKQGRQLALSDVENELLRDMVGRGDPEIKVHDCLLARRDADKFEPIDPRHRNNWNSGRNSTVEFQGTGGAGICRGRITRIIQVDAKDAEHSFAFIERYESLSSEDRQHDPFTRWPELQAGLVYANFERPVLVPLSAIRGHLVRCKWSNGQLHKEVVLLMAVDRVSVAPLL